MYWINKINFTWFYFLIKTTQNFLIIYLFHIKFLLDKAALEPYSPMIQKIILNVYVIIAQKYDMDINVRLSSVKVTIKNLCHWLTRIHII